MDKPDPAHLWCRGGHFNERKRAQSAHKGERQTTEPTTTTTTDSTIIHRITHHPHEMATVPTKWTQWQWYQVSLYGQANQRPPQLAPCAARAMRDAQTLREATNTSPPRTTSKQCDYHCCQYQYHIYAEFACSRVCHLASDRWRWHRTLGLSLCEIFR
jgi:hypothetical protein